MKIDTHILFLIVVVGIISAGLVAATVANQDSTMKQEVFDGIKVSVPSDSHFVKAGDGYYKDSVNGITIKTFKNNNSMVDYLKNLKKSKVISLENQPPQSVAFETGDLVSVLVTNGKEGVSVTTKDGKLTSEIANNIVFSDNHKTQKSKGIGIAQPRMTPKQDFNLIMLIVADVDTKVFNVGILEENYLVVIDDYNVAIDSPAEPEESVSDRAENESMSTIVNDDSSDSPKESDTVQTIGGDSSDSGSDSSSDSDSPSGSDTVESISSDDTSSSNTVASPASSGDDSESSAPSSSGSSSSGSSSQRQKISVSDCEKEIKEKIGPAGFTIVKHEEQGDKYVFFIEDSEGEDAGTIVFDAYTGAADTSNFKH